MHTFDLLVAQIKTLIVIYFPSAKHYVPEYKLFATIHHIGFLSLVSHTTSNYQFFGETNSK
jgi:hypothetical protein